MDSITQIALGATVSAAVGYKPFGRKVLLTGALLGTLPDLDVLIDYGNAIDNYTSHRGFSHSLFVLTALSLVLYALMLKLRPQCSQHKLALFLVIFLPLFTHPLLDTFTTYGTQLLWPLTSPPIAWNSIFIIDPIYTLPLLISTLALWFSRNSTRWLAFNRYALLFSCIYLTWGQLSQASIVNRAQQDPLVQGKPMLVMPTPFNSLQWRVVSYQQDKYYEAYTHLLDDRPLQWTAYATNRTLVAKHQPEYLARLEWFSHGWLGFAEVQGKLRISDLRLGLAGYQHFSFDVAQGDQQQWTTIEPVQIKGEINAAKLTLLKEKLGWNF